MEEELHEGDLVICTVERIEDTIVHVRTASGIDATIHFSEIASGRIRNIRDYAVPKKVIVCKVLRIRDGRVSLSLRRVSKKERDEVLDLEMFEKNSENIIKGLMKEKATEILQKLKEKGKIYDFLQEAKTNSNELESLVGKENTQKILSTLNEREKKEIKITKEFSLKSDLQNGMSLIKQTLTISSKIAEINYLAAARYKVTIISEDPRDANNELKRILDEIELKAKKNKLEFEVSKK